ncbi:hypothetical protein M406DRAFT_252340 [Cryphonectria parasitica EP155]|uniref:Hikeshi-like domain-containing protein n=1 Tax=Cryphonectria parasitica (strain ATCC 38755 / EP155) TaxID=660469 RepID=A0A9P4Y6P3_CRYP1|nr:uncharacterized protein M406DRAFT_252340 [Cryphonectria parasitica EP155]KAF3767485.1 hypothetical protein M406DRAFT_252340 [Cryphonectria parasitica EP155]
MAQPLFGLVPAGLPVITQPTETPTPTSFVYSIPTGQKPFSHVVIFLLPGIILPENTAAAIYLVTPPNPAQGQTAPNSRFLGGVGPGKESAIFKLNEASSPSGQVILGVSIEDGASVGARIEGLNAAKASSSSPPGSSLALVPAGSGAGRTQPSTLVLAQRIIKNAFNFLSSFSGQAGQVEVVPLRAFEDWWRKFESRVRTDPGFLERDE